MGRFARVIDGVALGLTLYAAAFIYFFVMTGSIWVGAFLAASPASLAMWAYRHFAKRRCDRRELARKARAMVERLVFLPEDAARTQAARYAAFSGTLLLRHPKGKPLDADEVLSLWRNAEGDALEIATSGRIADEARSVAEELPKPKVLLLDSRALAERYVKSGLPIDDTPAARRKISLRIPRKRAKHCAIYGCAMLGVFLLTGSWAYLLTALILLALTILAFRRPAPAPG